MNKCIMMGRLTRDPEIRYSQQDNSMAIARFSLAVDRRGRRQQGGGDQPTADFFNCTAFGRQAEFVEKYLKQGTKILISGRVQNDNYTKQDGSKVYSVQIIVEEIEFAESKAASQQNSGNYGGGYGGGNSYGGSQTVTQQSAPAAANAGGFMNIPDGIDEELPFN